jgi:hypothetical protein
VIRVQVSLRGGERAVAGDLPQDMHRDAGVGHPRQPCVPEILSA